MPARRPRIDTVAMPVAGLATHAKPAGLTTIFFEDEPVPVAAPSKPAYACAHTRTRAAGMAPRYFCAATRPPRAVSYTHLTLPTTPYV